MWTMGRVLVNLRGALSKMACSVETPLFEVGLKELRLAPLSEGTSLMQDGSVAKPWEGGYCTVPIRGLFDRLTM